MQYIGLLILAALTFAACWLLDRLFRLLFRSRAEQRSGRAVRPSRRFAALGLLLAVLGLACAMGSERAYLIVAGVIVILVGVALAAYYVSYGIYYDESHFLVCRPGKRATQYSYGSICTQQLFLTGGSILVGLHLASGITEQVPLGEDGAADFLNFAFARWCAARGLSPEDCAFHDTANSCWFPPLEGS